MRRRCFCFRLRTSFVLFIILLCLGCIFFTHRYISSSDSLNNRNHRSFPSLDKRKSHRYQAKSRQVFYSNDKKDGVKGFYIGELNISIGHDQILKAREFLSQLYPEDWATATGPDEMALDMKDFFLDLGLESGMSCKEIDFLETLSMTRVEHNTQRKYIEKRWFDQPSPYKEVTVKSQSDDSETKISCMRKIYDAEHCSPMGNYRMLREIYLLTFLKHSSLIGVLGYCLRGDGISPDIRKKGLVLVTEVGTPLKTDVITMMPWHSRIMFAIQLADLLDYLENSILGSMALGKVTLEDFVVVKGSVVKLVDFDDIEMGEKACNYDVDCNIDDDPAGLKCDNGVCYGFNAKSNMRKLFAAVFWPLLRNTKSTISATLKVLCDDINSMRLSAPELFLSLKKLLLDQGIMPQINQEEEHQQEHQQEHQLEHQQERQQEHQQQHQQQQDQDQDQLSQHDTPSFVQYDESNYPGLYDFPCTKSRVMWGCVKIVRDLREAKFMCDILTECRSFAIFTSQPELDNQVTVVLKNGADANPVHSPGTTLFIKKEEVQIIANLNKQRVVNNEESNPVKDLVTTHHQASGQNIKEARLRSRIQCIQKTMKNYQDARRSREKRLMAHMGLKGVLEIDWRKSVHSQKIGTYKGLIASTGQKPQGGKFLLQFLHSNADEPVTRAMFVSERGPDQFHVGQALTYHIDRLLGLYHTPPMIPGRITPKIVAQLSSDHIWKSHFFPILQSDRSLKGLFTIPMPIVMKPEPLALQPLSSIVKTIKKFSKQLKMQLEYVLLWGFAKISKSSEIHIGYKGHLIHFDADQAFQDLTMDITGYLYHCQFPNVVYKSLACFRCPGVRSQSSASVCTLGNEVIKKSREDKNDEEILIKDVNESQVIMAINGAASNILDVVDLCVEQFGKELVVY